jgi:hypothetical protein
MAVALDSLDERIRNGNLGSIDINLFNSTFDVDFTWGEKADSLPFRVFWKTSRRGSASACGEAAEITFSSQA